MLAKDVPDPGTELPVETKDLGHRAREGEVNVVPGRVAGPDDKVDLVVEVGGDPVEGGVDEGEGGVAIAVDGEERVAG